MEYHWSVPSSPGRAHMLVRRASALARLSRLPPRGRRRLSSIPDWLVDPPPEPKRQLPLLAIVGTPNVGKSTLVNRLCRDNTSWSALRQPALVSPNAGTTRDRLEYRCEWDGTHFRVWDTGGVVGLADTAKGRSALLKAMETQVREAVRRASVVLFMVDGRRGLTGADEELALILRKLDKPVVLGVNKIEERPPRCNPVLEAAALCQRLQPDAGGCKPDPNPNPDPCRSSSVRARRWRSSGG